MKKLFYLFVLLLAASIIFTSCRDDEQGGGLQTQSSSFTTTSPWTSSVRETTGTRTTAEAAASTRSTVDWLTFSPESGGAGTHTITITIEPNRTGTERSAVITIESEELEIEITVRQRYVPGGDGFLYPVHSEAVENRPFRYPDNVRNFAYGVRVEFKESQNLYYELDNRYSTFTSRINYSPSFSSDVNRFWDRSYRIIRMTNTFLTEVSRELERQPNADIERAFLENKGGVLASKGVVYFYLNTMFGGVPIITDFVNPNYQLSRPSWSEVSEFVRATLHEAIPLLECDEKIAKCWRVLALIALQKEEYQQAMGYLRQSISVLSSIHIPMYLLYAETLLKIGQNSQAVTRVNQVLQEKGKELLLPNATDDEVFAAIKATFPDEDTGVKYINAVRWDKWGAEFGGVDGHRKFLPIPRQVIMMHPNIVQNKGWEP